MNLPGHVKVFRGVGISAPFVLAALGGVACGGRWDAGSFDLASATGGSFNATGGRSGASGGVPPSGSSTASGGAPPSITPPPVVVPTGPSVPTMAPMPAPPPMPMPLPPPIAPVSACVINPFQFSQLLATLIWDSPEASGEIDRLLVFDNNNSASIDLALLWSDPRSQQGMRKFTIDWFGLPEALPPRGDNDANISDLMLEEALRFVDFGLADGVGALERLLASSATFLNAPLSAHYSLPRSPGEGWTTADGSEQERFGILTRGFWLTRYPNVARRGAAVMEDLLCQTVPAPPPGLLPHGLNPPPEVSFAELSRELQAAPQCAACHSIFDQAGVAFERFTAAGQYQPTVGGESVQTSGSFLDDYYGGLATEQTAFSFSGTKDYGFQLASSPNVRQCLVSKVGAYAVANRAIRESARECVMVARPNLEGSSVAEAMSVFVSAFRVSTQR